MMDDGSIKSETTQNQVHNVTVEFAIEHVRGQHHHPVVLKVQVQAFERFCFVHWPLYHRMYKNNGLFSTVTKDTSNSTQLISKPHHWACICSANMKYDSIS